MSSTCSTYDNFLLHQLSNVTSRCEDVNECVQSDNGGCAHHCENTKGSRRCLCRAGFHAPDPEGDPGACADFDECAQGTNSCAQKCVNEEGTYRCECYDGFVVDPDDTNGCIKDKDLCQRCSHGCNRSTGDCTCPDGYSIGEGLLLPTLSCHFHVSSVLLNRPRDLCQGPDSGWLCQPPGGVTPYR